MKMMVAMHTVEDGQMMVAMHMVEDGQMMVAMQVAGVQIVMQIIIMNMFFADSDADGRCESDHADGDGDGRADVGGSHYGEEDDGSHGDWNDYSSDESDGEVGGTTENVTPEVYPIQRPVVRRYRRNNDYLGPVIDNRLRPRQ